MNSEILQTHSTGGGSLANVYKGFVFIALGGLLFGYIIGINGNTVTDGQLVCSSAWTGPVGTLSSFGYGQCYGMGDWEQGFLSSMNLIGATLSSLACFKYGDILGRKNEVRIGAALYFTGAVVTALSPVLYGIYVGFLIYGLGIGFAMHAAPVYIAEISPAEVRGMLVSAKELVIVIGMFLGYAAGYAFSGFEQDGWRFMIGFASLLALVMGVGINYIPNSPRWLVLQSVQSGSLLGPRDATMEEATAALAFFRQTDISEVQSELTSMHEETSKVLSEKRVIWSEVFEHPKPLIIGCGLVLLQQVTGQPSVLYFATNIFKSAGFASTAALSALGVGFVKLVATFFTVWRVDQYGRRKLLMGGISMMIVALAMLSYTFIQQTCLEPGVALRHCPEAQKGLPKGPAVATVFALMLYVSGYQVGFGPISWLMISEVFPLKVRGAALSTAAVVNFASNIMMTFCQTALMNALTPAGTFLLYLTLSCVSFGFVVLMVPETKGLTLEQIERQMTKKNY